MVEKPNENEIFARISLQVLPSGENDCVERSRCKVFVQYDIDTNL